MKILDWIEVRIEGEFSNGNEGRGHISTLWIPIISFLGVIILNYLGKVQYGGIWLPSAYYNIFPVRDTNRCVRQLIILLHYYFFLSGCTIIAIMRYQNPYHESGPLSKLIHFLCHMLWCVLLSLFTPRIILSPCSLYQFSFSFFKKKLLVHPMQGCVVKITWIEIQSN